MKKINGLKGRRKEIDTNLGQCITKEKVLKKITNRRFTGGKRLSSKD